MNEQVTSCNEVSIDYLFLIGVEFKIFISSPFKFRNAVM